MAHVAGRARAAAVAGALVATLAGGCSKKEPAPETATSAEPSARPAPASELHEPTFDLTMKSAGAITGGQPSVVEIAVLAKGGYHVNDKYPYKFKPSVTQGLTYATPTFSTEATKLEEKRATMTVTFTPDGKGERTIAGLFAFSLCSADQCLIEKRDLALHVSAD